jgi:hypothetical protein
MARASLDPIRACCLIGAACALFAARPALAEPPAAIRATPDHDVRATFERFAATWMEKVHRLEEDQRRNPTVRPGPDHPLVTYRGYGDDFRVELRPTGHPSAPYVGILRYDEHLYSCSDTAASSCTVASTVPVTEIFRFEGGRWVY